LQEVYGAEADLLDRRVASGAAPYEELRIAPSRNSAPQPLAA
jgi:hypothetical protein